MINTETVFILGAGASVPYGYPTGQQLREYIIRNYVDRIKTITKKTYDSAKDRYNSLYKQAEDFTKAFFESGNDSIDFFLARNFDNKDIVRIGKHAIITSILDFEAKSCFDEDLEDSNRKEDWYRFIFNEMIEYDYPNPEGYKTFANNNITFITFNYDRSLEHYLYKSLRNTFLSKQHLIYTSLCKIPIYHIYGVIDELPWQSNHGLQYGIPIEDFYHDNILKLTEKIKILTERTDADITLIVDALKKAENIYFLGFGYTQANLNVLGIARSLSPGHYIYGTTLGLTKRKINEIKASIIEKSINEIENSERKISIILENKDCLSLLKDYL